MPRPNPHITGVERANQHARSRRGMLRLDMNEGVPGLPEEFVRQVLDGIDAEALATYPEYGALERRIAAHDGVDEAGVVVSNGSDGAIGYLFDAYVGAGDRVLITDPTFAMYPVYCRLHGAEAVTVAYGEDLAFPIEGFREQLATGPKVAVIVDPNNPTGSAADPADLADLVALAEANDTLLVVDEAYHYFHPGTVAPLVAKHTNLVVLRTFSKLCGLASLRVGYALASPEVAGMLRRVKPTYDVNGLAVLFAERVLDSPQMMEEMIARTAAGKALLVERLGAAGIACVPGAANFVLIDCGSDAEATAAALEELGVLVAGGFRNPALARYLRVTVGDTDAMERFWEAFSQVRGIA